MADIDEVRTSNTVKEKPRKIFKNPGGSAYIGHGGEGFRQNATWLIMRPYKMTAQPAIARNNPTLEDTGIEFQFLMPNELMETITHQWQEYECLAGRASQMIGEFNKAITEIGGASRAGWTAVKGFGIGYDMRTQLNQSVGEFKGINVVNYRIDTALHYKSSERRNYQLNLTLVETGDPWKDIIEIVKALQQLSAPSEVTGTMVDIQVPYVFTIQSSPRPWFKIDYAVINNIQPTYKGPYLAGVPCQCELFLGITDLSPLYDKLFMADDVIKIKSVGG